MTREEATQVCRWNEVANRAQLVAEIDEIFFEASTTKSFATEAERAAFRERWVGRYIEHYSQYTYLALGAGGAVAGYLVGSTDNPARTALFSDIPYFAGFSHLTADFPAHLHVNLAAKWRGQGIGRRLVEAFAEDVRRAGISGIHVVTARGMRNIRFYTANGFREAGTLSMEGRDLVFLARPLSR